MITLSFTKFKDITPEIYEKIVSALPLHQITCSCGHAGQLVRHAYYTRKLKQRKGTITLEILRVKCKNCGRTHAILCEQIVPYEQIPVEIQQEIIQFQISSEEIQALMNDNCDISESDIRAAKRRFKEHWKERLRSIDRLISDKVEDLVQAAFSHFHRQFLQIRRGINLENLAVHLP